MARTNLQTFELANPLYAAAKVAYYRLGTNANPGQLATLYADPISDKTASNPQVLDGDGKFAAPVYVEDAVVAQAPSFTSGVPLFSELDFIDPDSFGANLVINGEVIYAHLFVETDSFYTSTRGATYAITATLYDNSTTDHFFTSITAATYGIVGTLFADSDVLQIAAISAKNNIAATPYTETDTFFTSATAATYNITGAVFTDTDTFYVSNTALNVIQASLYSETDVFQTATVAATYNITGAVFTESDSFYTATMGGLYAITGALYDNSATDAFYTSTVAPAGTWQTTDTITLNTDGNGYNGYTVRVFVPQTSLSVTGGSQVRVTLQCPATVGGNIGAMYIGQASGSYSATSPAFAGTPTQIKFGGSGTLTLAAAGADVVSDAAIVAIPASNGLLIAMYISGPSGAHIASHATLPAAGQTSYVSGNDAATVAASGYTDNTSTFKANIVKKIEVFA